MSRWCHTSQTITNGDECQEQRHLTQTAELCLAWCCDVFPHAAASLLFGLDGSQSCTVSKSMIFDVAGLRLGLDRWLAYPNIFQKGQDPGSPIKSKSTFWEFEVVTLLFKVCHFGGYWCLRALASSFCWGGTIPFWRRTVANDIGPIWHRHGIRYTNHRGSVD
eukprot:6473228-Amphidinium_carterae.1